MYLSQEKGPRSVWCPSSRELEQQDWAANTRAKPEFLQAQPTGLAQTFNKTKWKVHFHHQEISKESENPTIFRASLLLIETELQRGGAGNHIRKMLWRDYSVISKINPLGCAWISLLEKQAHAWFCIGVSQGLSQALSLLGHFQKILKSNLR